MTETQLANLVRMESPQAVLEEVLRTVACFSRDADLSALRDAFDQTVALYRGKWAEARGCNTDYHNLQHVTDCFLAMARLLHDVGYFQSREDAVGTGAKFTASHVRRSMEFMQRHFGRFGLAESEVHACMTMIHATDLSCDILTIPFPDAEVERTAKMLGAADVLAQMADRTYLEKLLFLFYELEEANIDDYVDEVDLLRCSKSFYVRMAERLRDQLAGVDRLMRHHFRARWDIDRDLYRLAIEKQRDYLMTILDASAGDPRNRLRRGNIVAAVRSRYN